MFPGSQTFGSFVLLPVASRTMCELRMLDIISSDDEEGKQNVLNLFLDIVEHSSLGKLVESSFEDEELARRALRYHLAMDLLCQEVQADW